MITLTDSVNSVDIVLDVSFESLEGSRLFIERSLSKAGFDYFFNFGQKKEYNYNVLYATWSDARIINEWWRENKNLFLTDLESDITEVKILNPQNPFQTLLRPYQDQYNSSIALGEV